LINDQTTLLGQWTNKDSLWYLRGHRKKYSYEEWNWPKRMSLKKMNKK